MTLPRLRDVVHACIAPARCCGCDAWGRHWCATCAAVPRTPSVRRLADGLHVFASYTFDGPVRHAIIRWKEHGDAAAAGVIGTLLAQGIAACLPAEPTLVVPIPSSARALRLRGCQPLADTLLRLDLAAPLSTQLVSVRERVDQAGLGRVERAANMRAAFEWRGANHTPVLLVDDVATTGATLVAAAAALRAAGVAVCGAFVVATRTLQPLDHAVIQA